MGLVKRKFKASDAENPFRRARQRFILSIQITALYLSNAILGRVFSAVRGCRRQREGATRRSPASEDIHPGCLCSHGFAPESLAGAGSEASRGAFRRRGRGHRVRSRVMTGMASCCGAAGKHGRLRAGKEAGLGVEKRYHIPVAHGPGRLAAILHLPDGDPRGG